jgi:16S rRNA (uracil1498-N3)-methyltransferase
MSERFYVDGPLAEGPAEVAGPEARHMTAVCRVRPGDRVYLFNGDGRQYRAAVESAGKRDVRLVVEAVEAPERELGFRLEVAAPLPRGDRAQFLVEKLTELGATDFVPLRTARGVVQPRGGHAEKLRRYVIEASKQCGRNVLMRVAEPEDWEAYARRGDLPASRWLAHVGGGRGVPARGGSGVALAVGPEGGFTDDEVAAAREAGWGVIGLGPRVLRVETAALLLAAWVVREA